MVRPHFWKMTVSMSKYTNEWEGSGSTRTSTRYDLFADDDSSLLCDADREKFHHRVAKLLYLAKRVRPDILLPISFLAERVSCCTKRDTKALDQVYKYLNKNHLCLLFLHVLKR